MPNFWIYLHAIGDETSYGTSDQVADEEPRISLAGLLSLVPSGQSKEGSRDETCLAKSTSSQQLHLF